MVKVNNKDTRTTFKDNNKDTRTTPLAYFTPCSSVSIVNFMQVNTGWVLIKNEINIQNLFSCNSIERNDMMRELLNTDPRKATTRNSIPSKTLKLSPDISANVLQSLFNMLSTGNFPDNITFRHNICIEEKRPFKKRKLKTCKSRFWRSCVNGLIHNIWHD